MKRRFIVEQKQILHSFWLLEDIRTILVPSKIIVTYGPFFVLGFEYYVIRESKQGCNHLTLWVGSQSMGLSMTKTILKNRKTVFKLKYYPSLRVPITIKWVPWHLWSPVVAPLELSHSVALFICWWKMSVTCVSPSPKRVTKFFLIILILIS